MSDDETVETKELDHVNGKESDEPMASDTNHEKEEKFEKHKHEELDENVYTEQRLYNDMMRLYDEGTLTTQHTIKAYRVELGKEYQLKSHKLLKKFPNFQNAVKNFQNKVRKDMAEAAKLSIDTSPNGHNDSKSDKSPKQKSRKRKRESDDEPNESEVNETSHEPPKKKRRRKKKSIDSDECEPRPRKTKASAKQINKSESQSVETAETANNKQKKKKEPYEYRLTKLRKLLKVTHLANPRLYSKLKKMSNKEQVLYIKGVLKESGVNYENLSDKAIKKVKQEFDLKREMAELGLNGEHNAEEYDQTEALSKRRPKRNRNKVSYVSKPIEGIDDEDEDGKKSEDGNGNESEVESEEENGKEMDDGTEDIKNGKRRRKKKNEEASEESDVWEPDVVSASDDVSE